MKIYGCQGVSVDGAEKRPCANLAEMPVRLGDWKLQLCRQHGMLMKHFREQAVLEQQRQRNVGHTEEAHPETA